MGSLAVVVVALVVIIRGDVYGWNVPSMDGMAIGGKLAAMRQIE